MSTSRPPDDPEIVAEPDPVSRPARSAPPRGRGATANPPNRFVPIEVELDPGEDRERRPETRFYRDLSRSIISTNESPDVGFSASVNPYRGCEHGCAYCYARPYHEYLGLSAGLDFETKIWVKGTAPELLARELAAPSWIPQVLGLSGITDPYQPIERKLGITRRILEVLVEYRNPVVVITKNHLVARDADLLAALARFDAAAVFVSIPTLDEDLRRRMEPRTSSPARRLDAIRVLADRGIPVGVLVAPVIPGLTEPEIPAVLTAAAAAGATRAGRTVLRLPYQVAPLFEAWLQTHYPDRKDRVLNRVRAVHGGKLSDGRFGSRMRGEGFYAGEIATVFRLAARRAGLRSRRLDLSTEAFRVPAGPQGELFAGDDPGRSGG